MDFLNKSYGQLVDLFKSMSGGARITAALLLVVAGVSVVYLFNGQVAGPDSYLMGGEMFSASQLRDMQSALGKADLESVVDGARLKVPRGQESKYMAALAESNAMPTDFGEYLQKAVSANSFMVNRVQQEASIKIAKQRELQNIINHFHGVDKSAVQIDEKNERDLFAKKIITASVSIEPKGTQPLEANLAKSIRNLVASSVAGLSPEAITITDLRSGRSFAGNGGDSKESTLNGDYPDYKKRFQHDWEDSINKVLSYIPGVVVTANVELDPELSNVETSTEYDAKAVVFESRESSGTKVIEGAGPGGRPGLVAQGGVANQAAVVSSSGGMKNNDETSQTEQRKAVPMTQRRVVKDGRRPTRVTVSVAVPNTYYEEIWRKMNPAPAGQEEKKPDATALTDLQSVEKKKIEEMIITLLPIQDRTADAYPQVTVSTFYPISSPPLPEPSLQDNLMTWVVRYWSTLGMGMLALVSLVMLRSMVRAIPVATPQLAAPEPAIELPSAISMVAEDEPAEAQEPARLRLKRRAGNGPSLRDELADIVKEDPDSAVSILRTWIGSAS